MNRQRLLPILQRGAKWLGAAAALLALGITISNIWVLRAASPHLHERPFAHADATPVVAIVPGAFARGLEPSHTLEDRLRTAKELYNAGHVHTILVSGDHGSDSYNEVAAMRHWLVTEGVPTAAILVDHAGFRTLDTMIRARQVFGVTDAIVCTQRFHLARAVFLARRAGIDAEGVVADRMRYRGHRWNQVRETFARSAAFVDTYILNRQPRFL